jgi:hypothetical protein
MTTDPFLPRLHLPSSDRATPGLIGGCRYTRPAQRRLARVYREATWNECRQPRDWWRSDYIVNRLKQRQELYEEDSPLTSSAKVRAIIAIEKDRKAVQQVARELKCRTSRIKRWAETIWQLVRTYYIPEE